MFSDRTCTVKQMEDSRHVCVPASRFRASVALAFPILVIVYSAHVLREKGYGLGGYIKLLASGELSWIDQGMGWAAMIFWLVRFWPDAIDVVTGDPYIVRSSGSFLCFIKGSAVPIDEIEDVYLRSRIVSKDLMIKDKGGAKYRQSLLFSAERPNKIVLEIKKAIQEFQERHR